jgi:hypothetical protein
MERARGGGARRPRVCLSMCNITKTFTTRSCPPLCCYCSQNTTFTWYSTRKSSDSLSPCAIALRSFPPTCILVTVNEARSYFASTVHQRLNTTPQIKLQRGDVFASWRPLHRPSASDPMTRELPMQPLFFPMGPDLRDTL